jgi:hypothetical protein
MPRCVCATTASLAHMFPALCSDCDTDGATVVVYWMSTAAAARVVRIIVPPSTCAHCVRRHPWLVDRLTRPPAVAPATRMPDFPRRRRHDDAGGRACLPLGLSGSGTLTVMGRLGLGVRADLKTCPWPGIELERGACSCQCVPRTYSRIYRFSRLGADCCLGRPGEHWVL